jgi:hypothetical protein
VVKVRIEDFNLCDLTRFFVVFLHVTIAAHFFAPACSFCQSVFSRRDVFRQHVKKKHGGGGGESLLFYGDIGGGSLYKNDT